MKTVDLRVRKCPADIHAALVRRAERRSTSLRAETIDTLRGALGVELGLSEEALRRKIEPIPSRVGLTLTETREAIRQGRR